MTAADPERCPNCTKLASVSVQELPSPVKSSAMPSVRWVENDSRRKAPVIPAGAAETVLCFAVLIGFAPLAKMHFDEQYRQDVAASPILAFSPEIPLRDTIAATFVLAVSLIPAWIASTRKSRHWLPISILSVFGSWTCVGWIAAMMWACWPRSEA